MSSPTLHDGYWSDARDAGTSSTWRFTGAEGLARRGGAERVIAPVPRDFASTLVRVQLDHVALERERATVHRVRQERSSASGGAGLVTFLLVEEGRLAFTGAVAGDDQRFELGAGACALLDSRVPLHHAFEEDSSVVRAVVGHEHLPAYLQHRLPRLVGPIGRTALVDSFTSVLSTILRTTAGGRRAHGSHIVQAVADLQNAVIAEAASITDLGLGSAGLRMRIEQHIDLHLSEPDLSPGTIAEALDISVRQAHLVFNDDERTIARFIRERRTAAVAASLRAESERPRLRELAEQHGFGNADLLHRAFRAHFAMTPIEYWRDGYRRFGDVPLPAAE